MSDTDYLEGFKLRDAACSKVVLGWIRDAVTHLHWTRSLSREDIVSLASMRLFEIVSDAKHSAITSPKALIRFVVKCIAIDTLRREKHSNAMKEKLRRSSPVNLNPEELYLTAEEIELYLRARAAAAKPCRELWDLLFDEELTYKEIAAKLGTPEGALRVRHVRCKEKAVEWIKSNR